jgi:hypothetical protein
LSSYFLLSEKQEMEKTLLYIIYFFSEKKKMLYVISVAIIFLYHKLALQTHIFLSICGASLFTVAGSFNDDWLLLQSGF